MGWYIWIRNQKETRGLHLGAGSMFADVLNKTPDTVQYGRKY